MSFISGLLTLSFILHINEAKQTQLMESLQCVNDYKSFVSCTWSESQDVQKFIKMNLFYKSKRNDWKWNCYRNQSFFSALEEDNYTFRPDRKLEVQLNVSLFDNVQLPPPRELDISLTEEGLDEALDYEVIYKREWEPWERSTSVFVSNVSRWLFHHDDLVPGSTYVARVRSKPHQDNHLSGGYSEWSSAVNWTAPEGDEAQPKNLRCLFNGLDRLNCSWEVRRELTRSVSFALFYKISPESVEMQCSPVEQKELLDTPHVLQSCEIRVTNPKRLSQYLITVRPKEEEKTIAPVSNIKVEPPYELSVAKLNNQLYKLRWEYIKPMFPRMYQVLYWEADKVPEKNHLQNISEDDSQFTFQSLEPGTHYKAKMRAKAHAGAYDGPWSEWSKECEWFTESELPVWSFALAVPAFIILATVGLWCSKRYLLSSELYQKKTDTVLLPEAQAPAIPSNTSQNVFGEYVMTLPGTLESMPKERCALSTKDPGQNKGILVFNPDGKSPIFLSQVGDYCFFPNTKPVTKTREGYMGPQLAEDSHSLTKQPRENKIVENEPQTVTHICQV
ncbi:PREDICTED: cytokine receptor common subunit beta [Gekko japonicus]|uniref:Cytokine receptor common subunit beta n=1 Tax=Gekko japonicus TaxID=146911 RepID=A0ABM1L7L9_GEKJA|nr:PREDICTED: cytokine receptor common subunit beta [Gekko japonicus]